MSEISIAPAVTARLAGWNGGPLALSDFEGWRAELSGAALRLDALRSLTAEEPGLDARLASRIFPSLLGCARRVATSKAVLAVHRAGSPARTTIDRTEVAGWVALMVLGALPAAGPGFPGCDFAQLLVTEWPSERAKLRAVLGYFDRLFDGLPAGPLVIERRRSRAPTAAEWAANGSPLAALVVDHHGVIEDAVGCLQVDFANAYLGGGVLRGGCVQEEIRFAVSPELLAGMLISPRMLDDEAIVLRGSERFARTRGYARSLRYDGLLEEDHPARGAADVVAIDAIHFRVPNDPLQLSEPVVLRELGKARCGFERDERMQDVATGNWGCGAFHGDPAWKAVIQWLAASAAGRGTRYFTFGEARLGDLEGFVATARRRGMTVGELFGRLLSRGTVLGPRLYARLLED